MHPQRTALAALVLGIMLSPLNSVSAQAPQASGQVEVKTEASKGTSVVTQPKVVNKRDPFVKMARLPAPDLPVNPNLPQERLHKPAAASPSQAAVQAPIGAPPPAVTIHGIISSNSGNRAILASPNKTYLVQRGDKLGDYTVESVKPKSVVFRYKSQTFNLKLEDEFGRLAAAPTKKR